MYTNTDMTLYHWNGSGYDRREIKKVFWSHSHISNTTKTGQVDSDRVFISIPESSAMVLEIATGKDLVVSGLCPLELRLFIKTNKIHQNKFRNWWILLFYKK